MLRTGFIRWGVPTGTALAALGQIWDTGLSVGSFVSVRFLVQWNLSVLVGGFLCAWWAERRFLEKPEVMRALSRSRVGGRGNGP